MKPRLFYTLALLIVVCDQIGKWAVIRALPVGQSVPILGRFVALTHTWNTGGAFSLFHAQSWVFVVVALVAIAAMVAAYHRMHGQGLLVCTALSLALGGALGNLTDRIRFGFVVDFFDVHMWPAIAVAALTALYGIWRCPDRASRSLVGIGGAGVVAYIWHNGAWPIFNIADSAITIGISLLAWHFVTDHGPAPAGEPHARAEAR